MSYEKAVADMQHLDIHAFITPMKPAAFMEASAQLLNAFDELEFLGRDSHATPAERAIATGMLEHIIDSALTQVPTNIKGQDEAVMAVEMLRGSGTTPSRVQHVHSARRGAANYHALKTQLKADPKSPILSVFVNSHNIDRHRGVTIQTARSQGNVHWRNDPYRTQDRLPELIIASQHPVVPSLSKSEEQAVLDVKNRRLSPDVLTGDTAKNHARDSASQPAIVAGNQATILTDRYDPKYLLAPDRKREDSWEASIGEVGSDGYRLWLSDEFGISGALPSKMQLVAVGSLAIRRLLARFHGEIAPYLSDSTPAGVPEARRLAHHLTLAADAIQYHDETITIGPHRNIREDAWLSLATVLRSTLQSRNTQISGTWDDDVPALIEAYQASDTPLDTEATARKALVSVRQVHETDLTTADELLEAIRGELQQSIEFARS